MIKQNYDSLLWLGSKVVVRTLTQADLQIYLLLLYSGSCFCDSLLARICRFVRLRSPAPCVAELILTSPSNPIVHPKTDMDDQVRASRVMRNIEEGHVKLFPCPQSDRGGS